MEIKRIEKIRRRNKSKSRFGKQASKMVKRD